MNTEKLARLVIIAVVVGALSMSVIAWLGRRSIEVHARLPESGGWEPISLIAEAGKPLHLRLTSDDVLHGFGIGQSDQPAVDVRPGEISEVTLAFDKPGTYTYFCTRWCGANHWRMRGTIEVTGPITKPISQTVPLYVQLGLDIDAEHMVENLPNMKPSARRGEDLVKGEGLQDFLSGSLEAEAYLSQSPEQTWRNLRNQPSLSTLSDQEVWDVVAYLWQVNFTPQDLEEGRRLYAANCAACHGETGRGDGVYARDAAVEMGTTAEAEASSQNDHNGSSGTHNKETTDFTDAKHMLGASPALLQGKIVRGGMGTGMPYWGPIFTEEQTWALVAYLWTFQFELEIGP